jgi:anthranilate phosphoribosyltransferase
MSALANDALKRVTARQDLDAEETEALFVEVMSGRVAPLMLAALLAALRTKGEATTEIVGAARAMRRAGLSVETDGLSPIDTCGTGGDHSGTLNISTAAAIVAAAAGAPVAKHGNRAASSRCGSADVLETLGVDIELGPAAAAACLRESGITFLFAPYYHPAMRHAVEARRALGVPTIFNYLGPLTNPARVRRQVIGVADPRTFERIASVLGSLGYEHCVVVHGLEGLDEVSISGPTRVAEWKHGALHEREVIPEEFGLPRHSLEHVLGGDAGENAAALREILSGRASGLRTGAGGAQREATRGVRNLEAASDIVVLNAGCALYVAGLASTWEEGLNLAVQVLGTGEPLRTLDRWIGVSRTLGERASGGPGEDTPAQN